MRGFDVSPEWLERLAVLLKEVFDLADDDRSGELTLREFKTAMQGQKVKREMVVLGLEVGSRFDVLFRECLDVDGSGSVTLLEGISGFAKMKERCKNDERARELWAKSLDAAECPPGGLAWAKFNAHFSRRRVMDRLKQIGLDVSLETLWEAATGAAPTTDEGAQRTVNLDSIYSAYLQVRHPLSGDKAVAFLREMFRGADEDGGGCLEMDEFVAMVTEPKNLEKLRALGMAPLGPDAGGLDPAEAMTKFFTDLDDDLSGKLTEEEMVDGFLEARDLSRVAQLEKAGWHLIKVPGKK